jgi:uncharacterized HAD superfamily protein
MKIGIDIDDVITATSSSIMKFLENHRYKDNVLNEIYLVMHGDPTSEETLKFFKENLNELYNNLELNSHAQEIITKLKEEGNTIILITGRGERNEAYKGVIDITYDYLEKNKIPYDKIYFEAVDKTGICKEERIDILIDDSIQNCTEFKKIGGKAILFNSKLNSKFNSSEIIRASDWNEVYRILKDMQI